MKKYKGDKWIRAYNQYRTELDGRVSSNSIRIIQLEQAVEFMFARLMELKEDGTEE